MDRKITKFLEEWKESQHRNLLFYRGQGRLVRPIRF